MCEKLYIPPSAKLADLVKRTERFLADLHNSGLIDDDDPPLIPKSIIPYHKSQVIFRWRHWERAMNPSNAAFGALPPDVATGGWQEWRTLHDALVALHALRTQLIDRWELRPLVGAESVSYSLKAIGKPGSGNKAAFVQADSHSGNAANVRLEKAIDWPPPLSAEWRDQCRYALKRISEVVNAENTATLVSRLPQVRLHIDDIDSFKKVREVSPAAVSHLLGKNGRFEQSEEHIQRAIEAIITEPSHKKDWGGETNDLYTANIVLEGSRLAAAFLLKGNGLRSPTMTIADCGKNGDQLLRLVKSPAQVFFVQFVGNIDEHLIQDLEGKIELLRHKGSRAWCCVINGQDTARLLHAYGKA